MAKEREYWNKGDKTADYYQKYLENSPKNPLSRTGLGAMKKIIKTEEMPSIKANITILFIIKRSLN